MTAAIRARELVRDAHMADQSYHVISAMNIVAAFLAPRPETMKAGIKKSLSQSRKDAKNDVMDLNSYRSRAED